VLATVGTYKITQQEVDSKLTAQLASLEIQLYDLKKGTVEQIADEYLLQEAAKKAHLSAPAYVKREVDDKVAEPSDADLRKIYDQLKLQAQGPYDQIKPSLAAYVKTREKQHLREELTARLRTEHGFKILLKAPRFEVAAGNKPSLGPQNATVTILEFGDFQSPYCGLAEGALGQVRAKYGDKVRLVYADFPELLYPNAFQTASAARCAGEQGKFWQFHDAVFADQSKLAPNDLKATAARLKLDTAKFNDCLDKHKYDNDVRKDMEEGKLLGVEGTPAFYINGRPLLGAQHIQKFTEVIDEELASRNTKQVSASK